MNLAPVVTSERVELLDVLRGFAIFGILLVNQQLFHSPIYLLASPERWWIGDVDRLVEQAIVFFAQGKFYALFSLLFGLGAALQLERAEARGVPFGPFFARRLSWLLAIGLVHALLIWFGDILTTYALVGFALLLFRHASDRALLIWAVALLLVPLLLAGGIVGLLELAKLVPESAEQIETLLAQAEADTRAALEHARGVYAEGSWTEILRARAGQLAFFYRSAVLFWPNVLGLFLVGFVVGRRGLVRRIGDYLPTVRRLLVWLPPLAVVGNLVLLVASERANPAVPSPLGWLAQLGAGFGAPALTLTYALTIVLILQRETWQRRLAPLGAVGRMALTNYVLHSVVFTFVANSYGLGLYGRIAPSVGLLLSLGMFALQLPLSVWWLRRYRFGPLEWLWRSLTYGTAQPFLRRRPGQCT